MKVPSSSTAYLTRTASVWTCTRDVLCNALIADVNVLACSIHLVTQMGCASLELASFDTTFRLHTEGDEQAVWGALRNCASSTEGKGCCTCHACRANSNHVINCPLAPLHDVPSQAPFTKRPSCVHLGWSFHEQGPTFSHLPMRHTRLTSVWLQLPNGGRLAAAATCDC